MEKYLYRLVDNVLSDWKNEKKHKPILLRGARQVGKSSTVRQLAKDFKSYVEINFERQTRMKDIFSGDIDVKRIVSQISMLSGKQIIPGETLLFFDEIQTCKEAILSLRYFYEDMPELHVIAASSLLEFALNETPTFGVGRIRSLFLYPMCFDEFLYATGNAGLLEAKKAAAPEKPLPRIFHERLVEMFRIYLMVGGMPEAVATWVETGDYMACQQVQDEIVTSYEIDFAKYSGRINTTLLKNVLHSVVHQTGNKFICSKAGREYRSTQVREALEQLRLAGLIIPVTHTSANGLPFGAERNDNYTKYLYMDSGLMLRIMSMSFGDMTEITEDILLGTAEELVNKGHITEMVAGLELMRYQNPIQQRDLYYWQREEKNSQAEVDYLLVRNMNIVPMEVKAGIKGGMKSLYIFMDEKKVFTAIRSSLENFTVYSNRDKQIRLFPLYALSNI